MSTAEDPRRGASFPVRPVDGEALREQTLRDHAGACAECASTPVAVDDVRTALAAYATTPISASVSQCVLLAAAPILAAHAVRAYRRRLARSLFLALAPLPVVVLFNVYLVHEFYALLSRLLPGGVVAWMIVGYGTMVGLLCALTYAALPLLVAQAQHEASGTHGRIVAPVVETTA